MKKLVLTIAIVLGMSFGAFAQYRGGLFGYGMVSDEEYYGSAWYAVNENNMRNGGGLFTPGLPYHNEDQNQDAPIGGGALLLIGFGAAYALKKRSKK